jgi:hypothetical protein
VGAVAGAGAAGAVSVGCVAAAASGAVVGVGLDSSFFLSFLRNNPLKAFFIVENASGAMRGMESVRDRRAEL